jgi:hypothetical protein
MSEAVVIFRYPKKYIAPEDEVYHEEVRLPHVPGKSLKQYYADTRYDHHLGFKNTRFTVRKKDTREPVRTSYVPEPGEIFLFTHAQRMS